MRDNDIPYDLHEGLFLSCVVHGIDHVLGARIIWGIKYKIDFISIETTW